MRVVKLRAVKIQPIVLNKRGVVPKVEGTMVIFDREISAPKLDLKVRRDWNGIGSERPGEMGVCGRLRGVIRRRKQHCP